VTRTPAWKGELGVLLVVVIWGVNFTVMKDALGGLDPHVFNALRFTLSVTGLWLWTRISPDTPESTGPRPPRPPRPKGLSWRIAALGLGGHGLYQALFVVGLSRTSPGNSALLIATSPLWTAFIAHALGIERIRARAWLGLSVAFGGTVLLVALDAGNDSIGEGHLAGDLMTLGAAAAWGAYTTFSQPLIPLVGPLTLTYRSTLFAVPVIWLLAAFRIEADSFALDAGEWFAVFYSGFLSTGLAYVLWNLSIRRVGPSQTAIFVNLVPVVALACAAVFLGEGITTAQVVGGAFILLGIVQMRRAR